MEWISRLGMLLQLVWCFLCWSFGIYFDYFLNMQVAKLHILFFFKCSLKGIRHAGRAISKCFSTWSISIGLIGNWSPQKFSACWKYLLHLGEWTSQETLFKRNQWTECKNTHFFLNGRERVYPWEWGATPQERASLGAVGAVVLTSASHRLGKLKK